MEIGVQSFFYFLLSVVFVLLLNQSTYYLLRMPALMMLLSPSRDFHRSFVLAQLYLLAYNLISALGWGLLLGNLLVAVSERGSFAGLSGHQLHGLLTMLLFSAITEVFNSALGLVRSPVLITAIQVAARLWIYCCITAAVPEPAVADHWSFGTMVLAWCLVETVRYPYYFFQIIGCVPEPLLWLRYSVFYVLYPLGAMSEWLQGYQALPFISKHQLFYFQIPNSSIFAFDYFYFVVFVLTFAYPFCFLRLYTHMISQRRRYLGAQAEKEAESHEHAQ